MTSGDERSEPAADERPVDTGDGRPADAGAERPMDAGDERPVYAVGVGPGGDGFLTERARRLLGSADVVVGFESVLGHVDDAIGGDPLACGYDDEAETLSAFAERTAAGAAGVAALMGDPNHSGYQFLEKVEAAVDRPVRVVPGISSVQVAASRARTPIERSTFVTLHRRGDLTADLDRLAWDAGRRHLLVLPRPFDWMPEDVADHLLDAGVDGSLPAHVYERLTHDDEAVTRTTLAALAADAGGDRPADTAFSDLSVLVVRSER